MSIVTGILTGGANAHQTTSEEANAWATDFISEGIVGSVGSTNGIAPTTGSFSINAQGTPDMTVAVGSGTAYVTGTPSSQASQTFRVKNSATSNVTISANSSGSTKYDWVYIKLDATKLNTPNSAADDVATLVTSRSSSASSDDGTPPTYGYALAVVTVANGAVSITNSNIRDLRTQSTISSTTAGTSNDWYSTSLSPNSVTSSGSGFYSLVFNSTDLTTYISSGMKLKLPRTVTPPTQCTSLNGTNQYYSRTSASVAAITFTDDFVVSAWIKLSAYNSSAAQDIISRYNGTSGWQFFIGTSGQVGLIGRNASAANFSQVLSTESVPLNEWVHVSALLDMSAYSALPGTAETLKSWIMINGVEVAASVSRGGTNPTSLLQAGNLEIGSMNGGTEPFNGKIAQVALYSTRVTQAIIAASRNQTLVGSETSLLCAYSFDGVVTDLSSNGYTLTANNGALATTVDSPMNAIEYGVALSSSFSTNTTVTVKVPKGYSLPTSGGIGTVSYSTQSTPFGYPANHQLYGLVLAKKVFLATSNGVTSVAAGGAAFDGYTLTFTTPQSCSTVRLTMEATTVGNASGTNVFYFHKGSISGNTNQLMQYNSTTTNGGVNIVKDVPVIPNTAYTIIFAGSVTAGTASIGAGVNSPNMFKAEAI